MTVISITRLRVRAWRYLPMFFLQSMRTARQATRAAGNLGARFLRDSHHTFWTATYWSDEAAVKAFMRTAPHGPVMQSLMEWCDEASLVRWSQESSEIPSWEDAYIRLQRDGRKSKVNHPSAAHTSFQILAPHTTVSFRMK